MENNSISKSLVIETILTEYRSLRLEITQGLANRNLAALSGQISLIVAGLSGIYALASNLYYLSFLVFVVFLPIIGMTGISIWLGEAERISRLGVYLSNLENKINSMMSQNELESDSLLNWENWLRMTSRDGQSTNQFLYPYYAIVFLFITTPALINMIAIFYLEEIGITVRLIAGILSLIVFIVFFFWFSIRIRQLESRYRKTSPCLTKEKQLKFSRSKSLLLTLSSRVRGGKSESF
jgi:hypothetical protein